MTARTLRFEDKERKTIALHALAFYKVWAFVDRYSSSIICGEEVGILVD